MALSRTNRIDGLTVPAALVGGGDGVPVASVVALDADARCRCGGRTVCSRARGGTCHDGGDQNDAQSAAHR
jgi:hypothetical protein